MNNRFYVGSIYHEVVEGFNDKVLVICARNVERTNKKKEKVKNPLLSHLSMTY